MKQERHFRVHLDKQAFWLKRFWMLYFEFGVGSVDGQFYLASIVLADFGLSLGWSVGTGFGGWCYSVAGNKVKGFWRFGKLMEKQEGSIDE